LTSFGRRRQPPDARNSLFYNTLHHWDFGFVWTLFNPLGSTGEASGIPTLPVVPGLAAVADRAASRLPKSPLTNVSIRHTGSLVRAGDLVFHRIKRFFRAADGPSTLCRSDGPIRPLVPGKCGWPPTPLRGSAVLHTLRASVRHADVFSRVVERQR